MKPVSASLASISRRWFVGECLLLASAGVAAQLSAPVAPADARSARKIVQAQLDAFAANDAKKAFSFAAPNIKEMFGTAEKFIAMVQAQYPMVHKPGSVAFLSPEADGDDVIQRVQLTDGIGRLWMATYQLKKQKDKSWRIAACVVAPDNRRVSA